MDEFVMNELEVAAIYGGAPAESLMGGHAEGDAAGRVLTGGDAGKPEGKPDEGGHAEGDAAGRVPTGGDDEGGVAEAERRGYLRGKNEALELLFNSPAMWEEPGSKCWLNGSRADMFLVNRRKGVWE